MIQLMCLAKGVHTSLATLGVVHAETIPHAVVLQTIHSQQSALIELQQTVGIRTAFGLLALKR